MKKLLLLIFTLFIFAGCTSSTELDSSTRYDIEINKAFNKHYPEVNVYFMDISGKKVLKDYRGNIRFDFKGKHDTKLVLKILRELVAINVKYGKNDFLKGHIYTENKVINCMASGKDNLYECEPFDKLYELLN